jgi:hypothetical protein
VEDLWKFHDEGLHNSVVPCDVPAPHLFESLGLEKPRPLVRYVFLATLNSTPVIVKFAENYCLALHHFLAENGMAPTILRVGDAPPFWKIIVIEYLDMDFRQI